MKNLFIFDFDDTLAHSEIPVFVKMKDGGKKKLTSKEFAKYRLEPGDLFDFSEFNKLIKTATPIKHNVNLLKQVLLKPNNKVTILTARELPYPVTYWLKTVLGVNVYVVAVGSSDPNLKKNYIEKEIKKGYKNIFFIDDNPSNVMAVDTLKDKYPEANIVTKIAEKTSFDSTEETLKRFIREELKKY